MATTPQPQPPKPSTPPPPPPKPSTPAPQPPPSKPEGGKASAAALPIGAKPADPHDPQAAKFEPPPGPPRWEEKPQEAKAPEAWTPKAALDPRAEKPPANAYADGMSSADEQRARAAWVEEHGLKAYDQAVDQRPDEDKPTFDPGALAIGGAFVSAGAQKQVPGVVPPTKRE